MQNYGIISGAFLEMLQAGKTPGLAAAPPPRALAEILPPRRRQFMVSVCPGYPMLHVGSPEEGIGASPHGALVRPAPPARESGSARHPGRRGS